VTKILNVIGLALSLAGILILFRYGMPFRTETGGHTFMVTTQSNPDEEKLDRRYRKLGYLGLGLALLGTILQGIASILA
jgi:hypothetical protein